jgi:ATP-binding cassette subfamily F protein uup
MTYREKEELETLPAQIEILEAEQASLFESLADPQFYQEPGEALAATRNRLAELESALQSAYRRWEELDAIGR